MNKKGSVNIILVIIIVFLLATVGYLATGKRSLAPVDEVSNYDASENKTVSDLLSSWITTQSKFTVKAGESGTYNQPDKVQFISADTLLVHYDDGLVDHISVLGYENGAFTELKNVGVMSTMTLDAWQELVAVYGDSKYPESSYTTNILRNGKGIEFPELTKVPENVFVR